MNGVNCRANSSGAVKNQTSELVNIEEAGGE